jgi:hypothetical protein
MPDEEDMEAAKTCAQVRLWTVDQVASWLVSMGHGEYAGAFRSARVDGLFLLQLKEADLYEVGVKHGLHARHIQLEIRELLRPAANALRTARQEAKTLRSEVEGMRLLLTRCRERDVHVKRAAAILEAKKNHTGEFCR